MLSEQPVVGRAEHRQVVWVAVYRSQDRQSQRLGFVLYVRDYLRIYAALIRR